MSVRSALSGLPLKAAAPMLLDMAAPVVSFYVLHMALGVAPVPALAAGAVVAGARTGWRAVRERRLNAFTAMTILMLLATLALVGITGDPRLIIAKSAVMPAVGGAYGLLTHFFGRTLVGEVAAPFVTKGDPALRAAWDDCFDGEPAFARRLRLINLLWGVGFLASAVARVVVIYSVPLDLAVPLGQLPTLLTLAALIVATVRLSPPLGAALRARAAAPEPRDLVAAA